jgi:hypothetical protein
MSLADMDRLVASLFTLENAIYGPYRVPGDEGAPARGHELLPGTLYRYDLTDASDLPVTLQIYAGISALGGEMWEQEIRVLLRAAALGHPALPEILEGDFRSGEDLQEFGVNGFAFVATRSDSPLCREATGGSNDASERQLEWVLDYLKSNYEEAIGQFSQLADALSALHGMGLVHRNIWPGTIEVSMEEFETGSPAPRLRLARFEMSLLISNVLQAALTDAERRGAQAREFRRAQDPRALAYAPPERLQLLYQNASGEIVENERSDVYSLGVLMAEVFLGRLPRGLRDLSVPAGAFADPESGVEDPALELEQSTDASPTPAIIVARAFRLGEFLQERLKTLDPVLRDLLREMLSRHALSRPTAADIVDRLSDNYELLIGYDPGSANPYVVTFMPKQCRETLLDWGWVKNDPDTPEGRRETAVLIHDDLRGAHLVYAAHGADPFVDRGPSAVKQEAKYLLLGARAAWFCQPFTPNTPGALTMDNVLVIKYVVPLDSGRGRDLLRSIDRKLRRRLIAAAEVMASDIHPVTLEARTAKSPAWKLLMDAIRPVTGASENELRFGRAFDFLLEYQGTELLAHEYPYELEENGAAADAVLRFDPERDEKWRSSTAMAMKFAQSPRLRPSMPDFFAGATETNDDDGLAIEIRGDRGGRPAADAYSARASLVRTRGSDAIVVRVPAGTARPPQKGWLRPADDRGSWIALSRQTAARWDMLDNRVLLDQLDNPRAIRGLAARASNGGSGRSLTDQVALKMVTYQPLFAVQGPPGTGKTEVTARAVKELLDGQKGARILISAQSNYALDNLAERILQRLGVLDDEGRLRTGDERLAGSDQRAHDVVALRVASIEGIKKKRVAERISPFLAAEFAERRQADIIGCTEQRLKEETDPALRGLLEEWRQAVERGLPELADRLHRGANLIFATCSSATPENIAQYGSPQLFDWVVIEEAAKAWPTELAIPLSRGLRWSLVGDHHQLQAHRRQDVVAFLNLCAASNHPDLAIHGARKEDYLRVFDLFGNLFEQGPRKLAPGFERPTVTLTKQYRMRRPISEAVSRAFYKIEPPPPGDGAPLPPGLLTTGREESLSGLDAPHPLDQAALVWLDTAALPDCDDTFGWSNAGEVRLVKALIRQLRPRITPGPDGSTGDRLAVLTPYRRQAELLRIYGSIKPYVSTIHAFQGREADIVVVSLVRDQLRGAPEHPWKSIGHLTQPELVTVLLSRAKQLLVIVGNYQHFRASTDESWPDVCALVDYFGQVIPADRVVAP